MCVYLRHPAQSLGKLQFCIEQVVQDTEEIQQGPEKSLIRGQTFIPRDLCGHQFIRVLDLEDKTLHQDLPACLNPVAPDVSSIRPSSPTSAQLHILATSVNRSDAADDPRTVVTNPEDLLKRATDTGLYMS